MTQPALRCVQLWRASLQYAGKLEEKEGDMLKFMYEIARLFNPIYNGMYEFGQNLLCT